MTWMETCLLCCGVMAGAVLLWGFPLWVVPAPILPFGLVWAFAQRS